MVIYKNAIKLSPLKAEHDHDDDYNMHPYYLAQCLELLLNEGINKPKTGIFYSALIYATVY